MAPGSTFGTRRDSAPPPHELFELTQQAALNMETTWAWPAWHSVLEMTAWQRELPLHEAHASS